MNSGNKQRMVGIGIAVFFLVLFIPFTLHNRQAVAPTAGDVAIPAPPPQPMVKVVQLAPIQVPKPTAVPAAAPVAEQVQTPALQRPVTAHAKSQAPQAPQQVKSKAWVVQLASFNKVANARKLEKQLQAKGYAAYLHKVSNKQGSSIRVLVGPEVKFSNAEHLLAKLQEDTKMHGIITRYKPLVR